MNPVNDLIDTLTAYYGVSFTIVIIVFITIFAIFTALVPLLVWKIHDQTTRATKELTRLNKLVGRLIAKQPSNDGLREEPTRDWRADERVKEMMNEKHIEPLTQEKIPERATRRRKVFYKPEDELQVQKKKTS